MLIIGSKGFAKELLEVFLQNSFLEEILFFDNISNDLPEKLYNKFTIIRNFQEAEEVLKNKDNRFTLGIGNSLIRYELSTKFEKLGGILVSTISPFAHIGHFNNVIEDGVNIMTGTIITNDVKIKKGVLINLNCTVGHDTTIERYSELSPGVHISGHSYINEFVTIGTGTVVLPGVEIGKNSIIGAGSVVNKNIPENMVAVGIPAKIIKNIDTSLHS